MKVITILGAGAEIMTAICTGVMAIAIIAGVIIAAVTIKTTKSLEESKNEIRRKSLAKSLLFEVQDNNYEIDRIKDNLKNYNISKAKIEEIKQYTYRFEYILFNFEKTIYENFLKSSIDIDFKQEDLNPLLREYYKEIDRLKVEIGSYNNTKIENNLDLKKFLYLMVTAGIYSIKEIGQKLLNKLQIESNFNLEEKGLSRKYKPIDLKKIKKIIKE